MMMSSLCFSESVYKTCQIQPAELKLGKLIVHSMFDKICKFENHVTRNDVIITSLSKQWKRWVNADLRETKQIIYHSKGIDESYPKNVILIEFEPLCQTLWASLLNLAFFMMLTHQIWSCHVMQEANFGKLLSCSSSAFNIRKVTKFLMENLSTSEVISQNLMGGGGEHPQCF